MNSHDSPNRQPADVGEAVTRQAEVPPAAAGWRFDRALAALFPEFSRSRLAGWIREGTARLDDARVAPKTPVRGGETVVIDARLAVQTTVEPEPLTLDIRYRDADILVLCKPAGLVVHPGAGNARGTLQNALLHLAPDLARLPRAGLVHRLDKDTSGLLVVACSLPAHTALVAMLQKHVVEREYAAVVVGSMIAGGSVDAPLGRHPKDRLRQAVREDASGKRAVTHYRVRERFRGHTLVRCVLETGRTHQIRAHLAHIGHPLVGDPVYGGHLRLPKGASPALREALRGFRRQALHAERLAFAHPVGGRPIAVTAEAPADLQALLKVLREDAADA